MPEEVGVAYVRLLPSMRGFAKAAEREMRSGLAGPARKAGEDSGDEAGKGFTSGFSRSLTDKSKALRSGLTKVLGAELQLSAKTVAAGFSAQFIGSAAAGLASGAAKIAHGLGAVVALLPAAAGAGVLAFATLKVAVSGVGDALSAGLAGDTEKFDEALKGLSPSAQAFARSVAGMRGELDGLKQAVQESFFAPWVETVRPLADRYLPIIQTQLDGISNRFGRAVAGVADWLLLPDVSNSIAVAMNNMSLAVADVVGGLPNLVQAFLPLVTVGAGFLPGLTAGFSDLTARVRDFMIEAEQTGRLHDFISGGLSAIGELVDTARQLGRIFADIRTIASAASEHLTGMFDGLGIKSGGLLDTLEALVDRAAAFVQTAQGSETLGVIFGTLGSILSGALGTLQRIGLLIGRVLGPIAPQIAEAFEAFAALKVSFIDAVEPGLVAIGGVLGNTVLPALTGLMKLLARNRPLLQGIGIAIATLLLPSTIAWAAATLLAALPWLLLGAVIAGFAALVIIHFDTIKGAISTAFNWVRDNWPLLLAILTGPIGLAVLMVVKHWDTIKDAFSAVKDWIFTQVELIVGIIAGVGARVVGPATTMFSAVADAATGVASWVSDRVGDIVTFFTDLPGKIGEVFAGLAETIASPFTSAFDAVKTLWNNTVGGFGFTVPSWIPGLGGKKFSIPSMHTGGIVPGSGDDQLINAQPGEGVFTAEQMANLAPTGRASAAAPVVINAAGADRYFVAWLRHFIGTQGGGNVQVALGQK